MGFSFKGDTFGNRKKKKEKKKTTRILHENSYFHPHYNDNENSFLEKES